MVFVILILYEIESLNGFKYEESSSRHKLQARIRIKKRNIVDHRMRQSCLQASYQTRIRSILDLNANICKCHTKQGYAFDRFFTLKLNKRTQSKEKWSSGF